METLSFEKLPEAVSNLTQAVKEIKQLLLQKEEVLSFQENPLNIKEVAKLTELGIPTLYGYVQRNEIPYYKKGNRLRFFKSEVIDWIKTGKKKTKIELKADIDAFLSNKNKGLK